MTVVLLALLNIAIVIYYGVQIGKLSELIKKTKEVGQDYYNALTSMSRILDNHSKLFDIQDGINKEYQNILIGLAKEHGRRKEEAEERERGKEIIHQRTDGITDEIV